MFRHVPWPNPWPNPCPTKNQTAEDPLPSMRILLLKPTTNGKYWNFYQTNQTLLASLSTLVDKHKHKCLQLFVHIVRHFDNPKYIHLLKNIKTKIKQTDNTTRRASYV